MRSLNLLLIVFSFLWTHPPTEGANILVYIGMGSYSHRIPLEPLIGELIQNGHNITFLSPHTPKVRNPKIHEIVPEKLIKWKESWEKGVDFVAIRKSYMYLINWLTGPLLGVSACEAIYDDQEFTTWIRDPSTKFDLIIMDSLCNECAYGFAHRFQAKLVAFNTGQMYPWDVETHFGLPDETSSIPDVTFNLPVNMNFLHRAIGAVMSPVWVAYREFWYLPRLEAITKEGLQLSENPDFLQIERDISLYLMNNHWAPEYSRSLPPNVISVGGITYAKGHQPKPLPKHIAEFIEKGKEGFIYLSFGTVIEIARFEPKLRQAFIDMPRNFPNIQFIWKSTYPIEEKLPENVLVEKWLPQMDILSHPKIKLFITHGGLGGMYESIYSKVPMVCFPVFAEQEYNADLMENKGYAIKLEITTVTEPKLTEAVAKILEDPRYKLQVSKISELFTDRPMNPLDTAVWWLEFLLRHDNINAFLKPLNVNQSWWVRRQLDVWAFIAVVALLWVCFTVFMLQCLIRLALKLCNNKSSKWTNPTTKKKSKVLKRE